MKSICAFSPLGTLVLLAGCADVNSVLFVTDSSLGINVEGNTPPADVLQHLKDMCAKLEEVRTLLGAPITISSGYRSPALNATIGGAANSAHRLGYAVDFICPGFGPPLAVCQEIEKSGLNYDQLIHEYGTWTHLSFEPQLRRESLRIFKDGHGYQVGLAAPATGNKLA